MLSVEGLYSLPELSRLITQYTGQPVRQLVGIRPGVWHVQLASGRYVLKVRRHRSHLVYEQQVLESLGTVGVSAERLLHMWPAADDQALCLYSPVGGEPSALDVALSRAEALGRQMLTLMLIVITSTNMPVTGSAEYWRFRGGLGM